jgi:hypothetical protein
MAFYVTMTDKFMSGWGMAAGKINKLVIECDTMDEALVVWRNARKRPEMKLVTICHNRPSYNSSGYHVSRHDKTDYSTWFKEDVHG